MIKYPDQENKEEINNKPAKDSTVAEGIIGTVKTGNISKKSSENSLNLILTEQSSSDITQEKQSKQKTSESTVAARTSEV